MTDEERAETFEREARRDLPRNYAALLAHGLLGQTGFRMVQAPTFLPSYVFGLSGSDLAVGLARAFQALGMFLSPILGATLIEHRRRVMPVGILVGALMRIQVLGLALAGFFLSTRYNLYAVWGFLFLFGLFLGMQSVVYPFLVSKTIPVSRRGILMGLRNALAGITAAVVGGIGGVFVDANTLGNGYATTFLLSFVLTSLGLAAFMLIREPESPAVLPNSRFLQRLADLPSLLRDDREFTIYFTARALATMGRMALPFYILYAGTVISMSGARLGGLTTVFLLAQMVNNLVWGSIADRRGFRIVFLLSLTLWIAAAALLMRAETFPEIVVVFTALGAGTGGFQLSSQNLVLEFGARQDLPMRIAVANTASELVGTAAPILGGLLSAALSYEHVFGVAMVFQAAAVAVVFFWVEDPRRRSD